MKLHLFCIWATAVGTMISAYFILAANSWMQHPVGYAINHVTNRAGLEDSFAVLTNSTVLLAFPHTILGAFTTAGMLVIGISAIQLLRKRENQVVRRSLQLALPITLVAVLATMAFGDGQGRLMEQQQPMKMAAAEAIYNTTNGAGLSVFATGDFTRNPGRLNKNITIPYGLSMIADLSWNGQIKGIDQIQAEEVQKYGPGDYVPIVGLTYWTFRLMIGAGVLMMLLTIGGLILQKRRKLETAKWFQRAAVVGIFLPIVANWTGWIFTEMGRQPWVVFGLLTTNKANSPNVASSDIVLTLAGYIVIYGILIVIGGWLMLREIRHGAEPDPEPSDEEPKAPPNAPEQPDLILAYWSTENKNHAYRSNFPPGPVVRAHRDPLDRVLRPRGFRLRRWHARPRPRARQRREADDHPHDRSRLGRQRGVAAHRGRRHVRRVPAVVRKRLLGVLPRAVPGARRADRARCVV